MMCLFGAFNIPTTAQTIREFFFVEPATKNLPVFIRGNIESNIILLFVQGGGADPGIDFGRSDYPRWKNTLEKEVAIAYFDQRGLNRKMKRIDTTQISRARNHLDIILIAAKLREKYKAAIYLFGHSTGGQDVLDCLAGFPEQSRFITGGIAFNAPITTDFSRERYLHYRPLYLKNISRKFIEEKIDSVYWSEAYKWMTETDSIHDSATSRQWSIYTNSAYKSENRRISLDMVFKVIFSKPYNPVRYLSRKGQKLIEDKLWEEQRNLSRWDYLPQIETPVLLITGAYDNIAVPEELEEAHRLIPNSELEVIPNSKHWPVFDQPELFNDIVLKYLGIDGQ